MVVNETLIQGSEAWFRQRLGRATASEFKEFISAKTGALSAKALDYAMKLTSQLYVPEGENPENIWKYSGDKFHGNKFTDRGNELEPEAREYTSLVLAEEVEEVGFCVMDSDIIGCSPDGLIRDMFTGDWVAGVEIKCKCLKSHIAVAIANKLPDEHKLQVHGSMAVTGLNKWYFVSYFEGMEPVVIPVLRDEFTEQVEKSLDKFEVQYELVREQAAKVIIPRKEAA